MDCLNSIDYFGGVMGVNTVLSYLSQNGIYFLFIIVFLEYLNIPGLPGGIILPVAGIWVSSMNGSFFYALFISVLAALLASWMLYFLGWYGGDFFLTKYIKRFPNHKDYIYKKMDYLRSKGNGGVFVSKLIPMARTLISIPAGALRLNFLEYTFYSTLGIMIWNAAFLALGFFFKEQVLNYLM